MIRRARAVLGTACATHFVHDGFSDIVYVLLPIWSTEFGLNFAQVGLLVQGWGLYARTAGAPETAAPPPDA